MPESLGHTDSLLWLQHSFPSPVTRNPYVPIVRLWILEGLGTSRGGQYTAERCTGDNVEQEPNLLPGTEGSSRWRPLKDLSLITSSWLSQNKVGNFTFTDNLHKKRRSNVLNRSQSCLFPDRNLSVGSYWKVQSTSLRHYTLAFQQHTKSSHWFQLGSTKEVATSFVNWTG